MKNLIQASMSNQTNELKNMMTSFFQMNTASTLGSGSLLRNTIANPKGELKSIITRSGIVLDGPSFPIPLPFINPEEDERVEETLTDQDLAEYTIKRLSSRIYLRNLETVGKFLIPCGFSELKCKALADLGASINLMPLSVWKKLGLPELIFTRMTLELANRAICTPAEIARDAFILVVKFTFLADFVIVDYESDPRVPLILRIPFLRTARALIDVHGEETILYDGDERLTLNTRHDTSSYSNQPQKESINMINIYDDSCEDFLKDLFATNHQSGNPTFSSLPKLTLPKVKDDIFDLEGCNIKYLNDNPTPDHVLKPPSPFPIPVEDSDSFLEKYDTSLSYSDNSLPEYMRLLAITRKRRIVAVPLLMLITLSPSELTSIVDSGIRENVPSATNVNLPPEKDHYPLFAYVVWIFLSFLMYPVVPPNLLSFGNEDTIFDPGIANYHFPSLLPDVSHRCETFMKFNVYPKLLNKSPMEILSSSCSPMDQ
nr:reverse transcriptase domain-containing protein [Tanacetum cinerariifolium]